jgi:hypothetical protein
MTVVAAGPATYLLRSVAVGRLDDLVRRDDVLARVIVQSALFLALVLGSWYGLVLLPIMVPVLAVWCVLEERMLIAGLEGYAGICQ